MSSLKDKISQSKNSLTGKLFLTGFLVLLFLIPLSLIGDVTSERAAYRREAVEDLANSWANRQSFTGPVLVVPYLRNVVTEVIDKTTNKLVQRTDQVEDLLTIIPENFTAIAKIDTEMRYRGIYEVPVYTVRLKLTADFADMIAQRKNIKNFARFSGEPYLTFGISDMRGIGADTHLMWNETTLKPLSGTRYGGTVQGFHTTLPVYMNNMDAGHFSGTLTIKGVEGFNLTPVGRKTIFDTESPWPHPSFSGRFLPSTRDITETGFKAHWETGVLATNIDDVMQRCRNTNCDFEETNLSVSFYQPVNIYQQALRSTKYGILFIALTFVGFFLFESLQQLRIHPIQYMLVGGALAVFYLLLLSLSEHILFDFAYVVAALVTIGLLWFYLGFVLHSRRVASFFAGMLGILYALLYIILVSRDFALLLGTGLVFGMLVAIMVITRHVDWYALGSDQKDAA